MSAHPEMHPDSNGRLPCWECQYSVWLRLGAGIPSLGERRDAESKRFSWWQTFLLLLLSFTWSLSSTGTTAPVLPSPSPSCRRWAKVAGRNITVSGAVLGETIVYDAMLHQVTFTIVEVPADPDEVELAGGLAQVLHDAALIHPVSARDRVQQRETGSTHERGTSHRPWHPRRGWRCLPMNCSSNAPRATKTRSRTGG